MFDAARVAGRSARPCSVVALRMACEARALDRRMRAGRTRCHELRGALTAIEPRARRRSSAPAQRRRTARSPSRPCVRSIERAVLAVERPRRRPRAAPSSRAERPEPVDLEALVRARVRSLGTARTGCGGSVRRLACRARRSSAVPSGSAQALDNLIANALEHGGGRVTVVGRADRGLRSRSSVLDRGAGLRASARRARDRHPGGRAAVTAWRSCASRRGARRSHCGSCGERGARSAIELPLAPGGASRRVRSGRRGPTPRRPPGVARAA